MTLSPIRALIAEDDVLVADVIQMELQAAGVVVVGHAADGRQAVEMTCTLRPDIVLMDVQMPELDGIGAAREIQERCPTPVVVLTVCAGKETATQAAAAGAGAYLVKPPRAEDLIRAISIARARFDDLMELRRLNAKLREALTQVKTLSGLLPICCSCKKIRNDKGYWQQVESYIQEHTSADLSHGICPDCMRKLYPPGEYPYLYPLEE